MRARAETITLTIELRDDGVNLRHVNEDFRHRLGGAWGTAAAKFESRYLRPETTLNDQRTIDQNGPATEFSACPVDRSRTAPDRAQVLPRNEECERFSDVREKRMAGLYRQHRDCAVARHGKSEASIGIPLGIVDVVLVRRVRFGAFHSGTRRGRFAGIRGRRFGCVRAGGFCDGLLGRFG